MSKMTLGGETSPTEALFRALLCRMNLQPMHVLFQTSVLIKAASITQVIR